MKSKFLKDRASQVSLTFNAVTSIFAVAITSYGIYLLPAGLPLFLSGPALLTLVVICVCVLLANRPSQFGTLNLFMRLLGLGTLTIMVYFLATG